MSTTSDISELKEIWEYARKEAENDPPLPAHVKARIQSLLTSPRGGDAA